MSPTPATPPVPQAKGSLGKWLGGHKWEAGLGAGGIAVTLALALRARNKAGSSSSSGSGTSAPASSTALPVSYYPPMTGGGGSFDAGQFGGVLSQLSQELNTIAGQQSQQSQPSTPAAGAAAAPSTPGMGLVDTAQGQMIWLGTWGQPTFQVGGGAPVFFGNASSLSQGNPMPGEDVYTPVGYGSLVSKAPS